MMIFSPFCRCVWSWPFISNIFVMLTLSSVITGDNAAFSSYSVISKKFFQTSAIWYVPTHPLGTYRVASTNTILLKFEYSDLKDGGTLLSQIIFLKLLQPEKEDTCSMCGNFCAVKNMNRILDGEIVSIYDE